MNPSETPFRQWRRKLNITQAEAADILGYAVSRIAGFDRGDFDPPRAVQIAMRGILLHPDILFTRERTIVALARRPRYVASFSTRSRSHNSIDESAA